MITKEKYVFKILNSRQSANKIYKIMKTNLLYTVENKTIKSCNALFKDCGTNSDFKQLVGWVEDEQAKLKHKLESVCNQLNHKWAEYKEGYLKCLEKLFGFKCNNLINGAICYLNIFSINEIDFSDNTIFLNANMSVDKVFKNFIIMFTKLIVLNWWKSFNDWNWDYTYKAENKIWMFIEIAIDAIFSKTDLAKISTAPTYKYFYSITINGISFMYKFRELYSKICLKDFLNMVFMFVVENYNTLIKFKNYLH